MAQCWYVLLNLDVAIDAKQIDDDRVRALLIQVTKYAIAHMREDYDILYLGGYMITLMAQVYCEDDSDEAYEKWVTTGLAMLERAFFMKPEDARAATFYYGALPMIWRPMNSI